MITNTRRIELIIHIYRPHTKSIFLLMFHLPSRKTFPNWQSYSTMSSLQGNWRHIIYSEVLCGIIPTDTDVFKTSSGSLKEVTTSYDQTRRRQDVSKKTPALGRLEDALFTSSWRRPIYDMLKTSDSQRPKDVWFKTSWRRPIYVVLKTSNLRRLEDVWFTTS